MNKEDYEVIDNFLEKPVFDIIKDTMMSNAFPWYYNSGVVHLTKKDNEPNQYQFNHHFYENHEPLSDFFQLIKPIVFKINPRCLMRAKANLNPKTENFFEHGYHVDYKNAPSNQRTAVFYLNTNNGYTLFKDGTKVESIENRLVSFKTDLLHTGSTCTDENRRVLINFNYIL